MKRCHGRGTEAQIKWAGALGHRCEHCGATGAGLQRATLGCQRTPGDWEVCLSPFLWAECPPPQGCDCNEWLESSSLAPPSRTPVDVLRTAPGWPGAQEMGTTRFTSNTCSGNTEERSSPVSIQNHKTENRSASFSLKFRINFFHSEVMDNGQLERLRPSK